MGVNPATIAKAYQHLVEGGLLEVRRGEGTFVGEIDARLRDRTRAAFLREAAIEYARRAALLGFDATASRAAVDDAFQHLEIDGSEVPNE
jgi:DNA-binding transcriptional regulator YhcF (GntR family)